MYLTIREESRQPECPFSEGRLRAMVAEQRVPGIYSGNRFYIHHEMFMDQIKTECEKRKAGKNDLLFREEGSPDDR